MEADIAKSIDWSATDTNRGSAWSGPTENVQTALVQTFGGGIFDDAIFDISIFDANPPDSTTTYVTTRRPVARPNVFVPADINRGAAWEGPTENVTVEIPGTTSIALFDDGIFDDAIFDTTTVVTPSTFVTTRRPKVNTPIW